MGKLEDSFNLPEIIEEKERELEEYDEILKNSELAETDDLVNLKDFDKEMDTIADDTFREYRDLVVFGKDVEVRHAGEILTAASNMAKIALDAKTKKMEARLKLMELGLRKKRLELLEQKQAPDIIERTSAKEVTRDDLEQMIKAIREDDDDEES